MPYRIVAERLLNEWRELERRRAATDADPAERERLAGEIARIRMEYQRAIESARREHLPEPPPFPER